ncbi:transposase (plasmid) [Paracoccus yeei]|uniref:Transposase n=1 Tax=Paracoccus yeei TaxID=147645 RepID=A0A5P2QML4_9RHOB|nr:transposase [Paracoccus yeei]
MAPGTEGRLVQGPNRRQHYNAVRPHESLGYKPPAPEVCIPAFPARTAPQPRPATRTTLETRPTLH